MSHNPSDTSGTQNPSGSDQPPSTTDPEGANLGQPNAGQGLQGVSEVSDIVGLAAGSASAYAGFDPAVHATNPDGSPKLKKGGGFALKRGRKPADPNRPTDPRTSTIGAAAPGVEPVRISNEQAALMLSQCAVGGCMVLFGEEWKVSDKAEREALIGSVRAYLDATGGMDMSPSVGLVMAWTPYAVQRLGMPETQSRLQRFGSWLKGVFSRRRMS